jgi:cobalt-zinc-cadmium efflux system membrane fusion protein
MMIGLIRYLVFILVAAALVYGGYRMLTPATTKTTAPEKAEKE